MSSRLASFRGPSTPTSSPATRQPQSSPSHHQPESTYHRKLRSLLLDLRQICQTWEDLVILDGLKHVKALVDARTDLENTLDALPNRLPRSHLVGPKLKLMEQSLDSLDAVITKLEKLFRRLYTSIDSLDPLVAEAHSSKGYAWVHSEPLWTSWSLHKFANTLPALLPPYHRALHAHRALLDKLRPHTVSFEESKTIVDRWKEQRWLHDDNGNTEYTGDWDLWEEIWTVEVGGWR